jgi:hypothetical protein
MTIKQMDAAEFLKVFAKADTEFKVRSYSGRGMYGANCIGIDMDDIGGVMRLAAALIDAGMDVEDVHVLGTLMKTDSMGRGIVVYWPRLKLSDEQHAKLFEAELAEDEE